MTAHHREDLIRAARTVLTKNPALATHLSINETTGTVSDPRTGEVWAYVAPAFSAMPAEEWNGWREWPVRLPR